MSEFGSRPVSRRILTAMAWAKAEDRRQELAIKSRSGRRMDGAIRNRSSLLHVRFVLGGGRGRHAHTRAAARRSAHPPGECTDSSHTRAVAASRARDRHGTAEGRIQTRGTSHTEDVRDIGPAAAQTDLGRLAG